MYPRPAHVRGELVNLVEFPIDDRMDKMLLPKIADHKVVGFRFGIFIMLEVNAANPIALALKPLDEVTTDESTGAADQN